VIAILDPALLLTASPSGPLSADEEKALSALVDDVARIFRDHRASIPAVDWYWNKLQGEIVRPLYRRIHGPRLRQGLEALRQHTRALPLAGRPAHGKTRLWGVKTLFDWPRLSPDWFGVMERLLIGCAQFGEPTVLVTRLFPGRNLDAREVSGSTLHGKTRWRLYLHVPGNAPCHVPCIRNPRNLAVPWTTRFDDKLPDGGRYPFCPPRRWWRRDVRAYGTVRSKPAWVDVHGNGWAQPSTGGDYHWDVFIEDPALEEAVGLDAINVAAWGSTDRGKSPGEIHHISKEKKGRFRDPGWTCPDD
jgi:hypothetical protein